MNLRRVAQRPLWEAWSPCSCSASHPEHAQASCHPDKSARAVAELRATHIRLGTARAVIRTWMHAESEFAGSLHCVPTSLYCLNNPGAGLEYFRERLLEEMCWDNLSFLPSQAWGMAQASQQPASPERLPTRPGRSPVLWALRSLWGLL